MPDTGGASVAAGPDTTQRRGPPPRRWRVTPPAGGGGRRGPGGPRRRLPASRPLRRILLIVGVVVLAFLLVAVLWYEHEANPGAPGKQTVVTVSDGESLDAVVGALARQGVVTSSLAFHVFLFVHGTPVLQPGAYLLHRHDSFGVVRSLLASGPNVASVNVLPGFTVSEVAARVGLIAGHGAPQFLALATSGQVHSPYQPAGSTNLDGLLGPGTYLVFPGESDATLLGQMIERFDTTATRVGLTGKAAALGVTPYQAIIVASIDQKEGVYSENLGKVARVIYNRLARGTPLQMDSTVLYSEHRDGGPVTSADLALNTPYNTYLHTGLTPTPIAFPSESSLRAALAPTPGNWLYFVVVSKNGTEAFSTTLAGQLANERLAKSRGLG